MGVLVSLLFLYMTFPKRINGDQQEPPSPGYSISEQIESIKFENAFKNLWGPNHQHVDEDGIVTLILDKSYGGSGFVSLDSYTYGYFGAAMKLDDGPCPGVNSNIYLSNDDEFPGHHDEVDIELLGHTLTGRYVLQTNVYINGSGDGPNLIGREMRFHLWFNPAEEFHQYGILWNDKEIIFFVDDVPIRWYQKKSAATFPMRAMKIDASIWDASGWATNNGKHKINFNYQPFIVQYNDFKVQGCPANSNNGPCKPPPRSSPTDSTGLSDQQIDAMKWVQRNYMVYNYCKEKEFDSDLIPECY